MTESASKVSAERIFNFSAGPAVLPESVLLEAQRDMFCYPGAGMSVMEMSHRGKAFDAIHKSAEAGLREVMGIPDNYRVLFLQGGASLQFSMIPMNFLPSGGSADYVVTGSWGKKAVKEAKRCGAVNIAATTADSGFSYAPAQEDLKLDPAAAYVHYTDNETIEGVEFNYVPETGNVPLINDCSSNICSKPIDVNKFALIYGGAQKNMGPSGVTIVILRDDLLQRRAENLHTMLDYQVQVDNDSLYNTPNTWGIYIIDLICKWLKEKGGLAGMQVENAAKAKLLYDAIDATDFYRGHAAPESRSLMNITFRLPSEELEKKFASEATALGLDGLKGHRSVGGIRASVYNAFPKAGVEALVSFMKEFEKTNG